MKDLFIDLETYYDRQYTLRTMTTAEYVLSPYFECYMCGWAIGNSPVQVTAGVANVRKLMSLLPWPELRVVCHNIHFDAAVLAWHFGVPRPGRWACSLAAMRMAHPEWRRHSLGACARELNLPETKGEELARMCGLRWQQAPPGLRLAMLEYNTRDIVLLRKIWAQRPACLDGIEGEYLDLSVRLWTEPRLDLDTLILMQLKSRNEFENTERAERVEQYGISPSMLRSDQQLAAHLTVMGASVPYKASRTTADKLIPALAKNDPDLQDWAEGHRGPVLQDIALARIGHRSSIERTRVERLMAIANATRGVLPVPLLSGNTNTWRLAGGEKLNLQNLPRTEKDKIKPHPLRQAVIARAPYRVVRVDAAQIECRILAWWAQETWLNEAFAKGDDPYCIFGTGLFGFPVTKGMLQRQPSKIAVLSCGYGASPMAFTAMLIAQTNLPKADVGTLGQKSVTYYRQLNTEIVKLWTDCEGMLQVLLGYGGADEGPMRPQFDDKGNYSEFKPVIYTKGKAILPSGHEILYPGIGRSSVKDKVETGMDYFWVRRGVRRRLYGPLLVENAVQAMARDHVMEVWRRIARDYPWIGVALQVHDDLAAVVHEDRAAEALEIMKHEMSQAPAWAPGLVLDAGGGVAVRLGEAKED